MIPVYKRKIWVCILLSLFTFGIYLVYWRYLMIKNTKSIKRDDSGCAGELLLMIFLPFYSVYWWYTRGNTVETEFSKHGYSASGNKIAYLLLLLFGLEIVALAIMQHDFNSLKSVSELDEESAREANA